MFYILLDAIDLKIKIVARVKMLKAEVKMAEEKRPNNQMAE
jgi:hypothetical protein